MPFCSKKMSRYPGTRYLWYQRDCQQVQPVFQGSSQLPSLYLCLMSLYIAHIAHHTMMASTQNFVIWRPSVSKKVTRSITFLLCTWSMAYFFSWVSLMTFPLGCIEMWLLFPVVNMVCLSHIAATMLRLYRTDYCPYSTHQTGRLCGEKIIFYVRIDRLTMYVSYITI